MIIVTGEPRSGTSLTMETIRLLGVPVWGSEQPGKDGAPGDLTDELRKQRRLEMNEKFWEVGAVVMRGLSPRRVRQQKANIEASSLPDGERLERLGRLDGLLSEFEEHKDDAVKIIWTGLPRTDDDILQNAQIVFVTRHPLAIAESQRNLESQVGVAVETGGGFAFESPRLPLAPARWVSATVFFLRWILRPKNAKLKILLVDYDEFFDASASAVDKLAKLLGRPPFNSELAAAKAAIDPQKRRSSDAEVPEGEEEDWAQLEIIYSMLKQGEWEAALAQAEDYIQRKQDDPENSRWLDPENFWPMTPGLKRSMISKEKLRSEMEATFHRNKTEGKVCTSCDLFSPTGELYTIRTPSDLEDVVRKRIECAEEGSKTLEECQAHWAEHRRDPDWLQAHSKESR